MRLCWGTTPAMPGLSRFTSYDSAFTSAPRALIGGLLSSAR